MAGWITRFFGTAKCQSCETLKEQLRESRLREQRMSRQMESKDSQIAMVLASKFDRPVINAPAAPPDDQMPIDHLMDVVNLDDEEFLKQAN